MALNLANFIRTALRAPIGPMDNVLQLAVGTGAYFNIPAGDYCYITLEDRLNSEIVKYTSTGPVIGDNISVMRAQDGTLAHAFPSGTCVKVAWNEQQVKDLIAAMFTALVTNTCPPPNTVIVEAVPIGAPPSCVFYAVNKASAPWSVYYWDGSIWHLLGDGNTIYTGIAPINVNAATKEISIAISNGLKIESGKVVVDLAPNSGLSFTATGQITYTPPTVGVGVSTVGVSTVGVGVSTVGVSTVGVSTVGVSTVGVGVNVGGDVGVDGTDVGVGVDGTDVGVGVDGTDVGAGVDGICADAGVGVGDGTCADASE